MLNALEITELVEGLNRLARNLWWTWNPDAQELFQELSPRGWQNLHHNAVAILHEVSPQELRVRLMDPNFAARIRNVMARFEAYMNARDTWARTHAPELIDRPVAYFSAEFGLHETLPIAAGGLGILAGDHAKSASDLGLGFVGISLFYREGYFQQAINHENWQTEYYTLLKPELLPMEPVLDTSGNPLVCEVDINTDTIRFLAWKANVGRCCLYFLDSNHSLNDPHLRDLTLRVYGGDNTTRLMQEIVMGIGGVRLLRALGVQPSVFHLNEGHAAFLVLELIREKVCAGMDFKSAFEATRQECIFTTHTPVEAGHDRFSPDLLLYALDKMRQQLGLTPEEFCALGRIRPLDADERFCMTVLALKTARTANGVSALHGEVTRKMWHPLFPNAGAGDVPIGHITNGIHLLGWMKGTVRSFWKHKLGSEWERDVNTVDFWERIEDPTFISDEEIWVLRYKLRRELVEFTRRRFQMPGHHASQADFIAFDRLLNPDALTIGFARRFAVYKRGPLVFENLPGIISLVTDSQRPVQFIFAGKAHPQDDQGKSLIQKILHLSKSDELKGRLVFIENYDIFVARRLVSGCDVWLNTPRRPMEASGTSGQKTACHGGLNLSILDGWWREGFDGTNGFAIGEDSDPDSIEEQDRMDSENLYRTLAERVVPLFYERDERGIPRKWIAMIRRAMVTLVPRYNTWRMVQEYTRRYYLTH